MKKRVKDVRKSISERKKSRGIPTSTKTSKVNTIMPSLPQEEEKHGFYPNFIDQTETNREKNNTITGIILKGLFSVMLFFSIAIIWQNDAEIFDKPKEWTASVLTEEFPFASVYQWYKDSFGTPLAFSPAKETVVDETPLALPVSGNVIETFQTNGKGITIAPTETTSVQALREGIVIFSGKKSETNKTIVIQHADKSTTTYGFLSSIDVHLYQIVDANQRIGEFNPTDANEVVYFSIEKNNEFVDPVQVIEVDDQP
ncbi:M23 family metallopeptidase [Ornithinibacillus halotolerans]|uniref:Stage IV sporulation protein FA n=1 Tax=Ornithinibacillus halotolerans TaxID=1274357 RepID=A0A916S7U2_9BACI|nr:M23 family metallopeptidase [Ornithinibacillus halotolerans]GGA85899.1 stage IV sporulation protein FA [Ornithinibacillus halotolerans]